MFRTATAVVAGLLLCATGIEAAPTDREKFQRKVSSVAPAQGVRGKALCYCNPNSSSSPANRVGLIRHRIQDDQVVVACEGDNFNSAGTDIGFFRCSDFLPLSK